MFVKNLYLTRRFFIAFMVLIGLFLLAYSFPALMGIAQLLLVVWILIFAIELISLFRFLNPVYARRLTPERLANGNENNLSIVVENRYPFTAKLSINDELPFQFQKRDFKIKISLKSGESKEITYQLRPVKRGEYLFGVLNVYASGNLGFAERRFRFDEAEKVPVYPSFMQMRKYELLAISNRLAEAGVKKVRRIGHSMEFEHIRNYVLGDDPRSINWKATARHGSMMVNAYQEERSQQVFCIIDKGRAMQMPFEGLSLLDYSINAALVLSNTVILKGDKAGLITFSDKMGAIVPAGKQKAHMNRIMEVLYKQLTHYLEPDYERLCIAVQRKVTQRSLLVLFTNFETQSGMKRQLPYLRRLAKKHLLLIVFFINTELEDKMQQFPENTEGIYLKTTVEQLVVEKRLIVKELNNYGIQTILTRPEDLTINTINKYLALKARRMI